MTQIDAHLSVRQGPLHFMITLVRCQNAHEVKVAALKQKQEQKKKTKKNLHLLKYLMDHNQGFLRC